MSQTAIEPCEFCDEPSIVQLVVAPADSSGTKPLRAWVCDAHAVAVRSGEGWQARERRRASAAKKELQERTDEAAPFDPLEGLPAPRRGPYGEAA